MEIDHASVSTIHQDIDSQSKYLKDYKKPTYLVDNVRLEFLLDDEGSDTKIYAKLLMRSDCKKPAPLVLDGEILDLVPGSLKINGCTVPESKFIVNKDKGNLTIDSSILPDFGVQFAIESTVRIKPVENLTLSGLYMSDGSYCTQCEAEGFRRITYFPDRPDCMAIFSVRITASKKKYPVLLSNGNCVASGTVENNQELHWVEYEDPYKKPSYLFALVAGDLVYVEDTFKTVELRNCVFRIYVEKERDLLKCAHAMESLKNAAKWDEEVYGLAYDLDIYNIVAISSFNMGAMENKSLNIFNSKYILASKETATDNDFNNVEGVVGHEYFHNYSGNRVTVNSWFELSLKEGFTVFRDQCFSEDMRSAVSKRINDVSSLRTAQFAEDSGPLAHPIRPASYQTINNFYTTTIYDKGAEVIRMLRTLCGEEGFRRGTDLYFSRYDGQAITCIHWLDTIHEQNPEAFHKEKFARWYSQAGTPEVTVSSVYSSRHRTLTLNMKQVVPPTHKQPDKLPATIPISTGLIGPDGDPVLVDFNDGSDPTPQRVLVLSEASQKFTLHNVPRGSMPSLLRNFSAPVKLRYEQGEDCNSLAFQMEHDSDDFNRWEAGQRLSLKVILDCLGSKSKKCPAISAKVLQAFKGLIKNKTVPYALRAQVLHLPSESYIIDQIKEADPVEVRKARNYLKKAMAIELEEEFWTLLEHVPIARDYSLSPEAQGARALRNTCMSYLSTLEPSNTKIFELAYQQVQSGNNMTDIQAGLTLLAGSNSSLRQVALNAFYEKYQTERLVVDKWMQIQATAPRADSLKRVQELMKHEAFDIKIPNCVYAVIRAYAYTNLHIEEDGSGYKFLADQIITIDRYNPQVAARVARAFTRIKKYNSIRQDQMKKELLRIKNQKKISTDVREVIDNCLQMMGYMV